MLAALQWRGFETHAPCVDALEEIEKKGIPGMLEVLREEGIDAVGYALRDLERRGFLGNAGD
jgi:hypothetical protein